MEVIKVTFPEGVYIHILEYAANTPIKEENVKNEIILKGILKTHIQRRYYYYKNLMRLPEIEPYSEYNNEFLKEYDANTLIKSLNTCKCCDRHQKNRPKHIKDYSWIKETYNMNQNKNYRCKCYCRMNSRLCFRLHYDFNIMPEPEPDPEPEPYPEPENQQTNTISEEFMETFNIPFEQQIYY